MINIQMSKFNFLLIWLTTQQKGLNNMVKMIGTQQNASSATNAGKSSWSKGNSYSYSSYRQNIHTAFSNDTHYPIQHNIDEELLLRTHRIQINFADDEQLYDVLLPLIADICPQANVTLDMHKNIYVVKGEGPLYPCFAAHSDQVHDIVKNEYFSLHIANELLFAFNAYDMTQVGTGSDDKAGIYVCLEALRYFDNVKVVIFADEEIGCQGSSRCDMTFFDDCTIVMQGDRFGDSEWITRSNGVSLCDDDFILQSMQILDKYGYKDSPNGSITDVGELTLQNIGIVTANVAIGYKNQHCDNEVLHIPSLERAMNLMFDMADYWSYDVAEYTVPQHELMYNGYYCPYDYATYYEQADDEYVDPFDNEIATKYGKGTIDVDSVGGFCPDCYAICYLDTTAADDFHPYYCTSCTHYFDSESLL